MKLYCCNRTSCEKNNELECRTVQICKVSQKNGMKQNKEMLKKVMGRICSTYEIVGELRNYCEISGTK